MRAASQNRSITPGNPQYPRFYTVWVIRVDFGMSATVRLLRNLGSADCPILMVEGISLNVTRASNGGSPIIRYELGDFEWAAISRFFQQAAWHSPC